MSHMQDNKQLNLGPPGDIGDLEHADLAPPTGEVQDRWHTFWDGLVIPPGQYSDRAKAWMESLGFTGGHVQDLWAQYWASFSFSSAVVNSISTVTAYLSDPTSSIGVTLETGVSIEINGVPATITGSVLAGDALSVVYTITENPTGSDNVRVIYDSGVGAIISATTGAPMTSTNTLATSLLIPMLDATSGIWTQHSAAHYEWNGPDLGGNNNPRLFFRDGNGNLMVSGVSYRVTGNMTVLTGTGNIAVRIGKQPINDATLAAVGLFDVTAAADGTDDFYRLIVVNNTNLTRVVFEDLIIERLP